MKKILIISLMICSVLFGQAIKKPLWRTTAVDTLSPTDMSTNVHLHGDLTYRFIRAVGSADSIAVSIGGTQNVYYKIVTNAMTWRETDGLTCAGDSVTILTKGDYIVHAFLAVTTVNANDIMRVKMYVNHTPSPASYGRWIINSGGAGLADVHPYLWYRTLQANDVLSFYITNQTGSRAVSIQDFKIYVEKKSER